MVALCFTFEELPDASTASAPLPIPASRARGCILLSECKSHASSLEAVPAPLAGRCASPATGPWHVSYLQGLLLEVLQGIREYFKGFDFLAVGCREVCIHGEVLVGERKEQ